MPTRHGKSKNHIDCAVKCKLFGRVRIDKALDLARTISTKKHNEQVKKNRDILRKLIIAALYLARQEQAFRGHNEAAGSSNRGNFVELVRAFAEFDTALAEHLGSSTVFSGMSNTIQNDIIESIARSIQDETDKEIHISPFIAVQVDDTSDISNKCQLTVIIRYVNEKGSVCLRFLGFFDVSLERDAKAVTSVVMSVPGGSDVRWNFKSRTVNAIHEGRGSLCIAFEKDNDRAGMGQRDHCTECFLEAKT